MKCPKCYCNYDDSERECPMCGTRAGWAADRSAGQRPAAPQSKGRTLPETRPVQPRPARRVQTSAFGAPDAGKEKARTAASDYRRDPAEAMRRRRRSVLIGIVVVFVLIEMLPAIIGQAFNAMAEVRRSIEYRDNGFHVEDRSPDVPAQLPGPAEDEAEYGEEYGYEEGYPLKSGSYFCEETGLFFEIDNANQTYWIHAGDYEEAGYFYLMYNDPEENSEFYTEEFPAWEYESYVFYLLCDDEWAEEDDIYTLAVAYLPLEGSRDWFYMDNTYASAFWLPLDRAVVLECDV